MGNLPVKNYNISLGLKVCDCFFSGAGVSLMLFFLNGLLPPNLTVLIGGGVVLAAIIFLVVWNYHGTNQNFPHTTVHAWLLGVIRYCFAYCISVYGFAKILKTQFGTVYSRNDTTVGSLNGFNLTWNYFGCSYKLAVILAVLQIGGGILLLFRRTTLAGVFVLMPVMVNIVLINIFYSIDAGAFLVSMLITGALTYLLLLNREVLIQMFFRISDNLPPIRSDWVKHVIRMIIMVLAFFTVYRFIINEPKIDFLGKWKVVKMERNGQLIGDNAWMTDSTAWKYVYIEEHGGLAFSSNPYVFEPKKATTGMFKYDEKTRKLNIKIFEKGKPQDSIMVSITKKGQQAMVWVGTSKTDRFTVKLIKSEVASH